MTELENELAVLLCDVVDQNFEVDKEDVFFSGFIRAHKEALIKLVDLGYMEEVTYGHESERDSPFRSFSARFIKPPWMKEKAK